MLPFHYATGKLACWVALLWQNCILWLTFGAVGCACGSRQTPLCFFSYLWSYTRNSIPLWLFSVIVNRGSLISPRVVTVVVNWKRWSLISVNGVEKHPNLNQCCDLVAIAFRRLFLCTERYALKMSGTSMITAKYGIARLLPPPPPLSEPIQSSFVHFNVKHEVRAARR